MPLKNIPLGTKVHCIEMLPVRKIARSAGSVKIGFVDGSNASLKMPSGEIRLVNHLPATIGDVGNGSHQKAVIGVAGTAGKAVAQGYVVLDESC